MKFLLTLALIPFIFDCMANTRTFSPCPKKANCVSSQTSQESKHYISPIEIIDSKDILYQKLLKYLSKVEGFKVVEKDKDYIRAEYTTSLFRFVDDLEFIFNDKFVDIRSASRKGYYDFGKNRERLETIRFKYLQKSL